ncbi:FadD3 family acyl-CoA ligase [Haloechinothrix aidingensis]|uniref:FadD3 family acyl-CoA ligase n=1 Tax=Haloechinothrix aidingensis TaxID=2752311 RepID=UPI0031B6176F
MSKQQDCHLESLGTVPALLDYAACHYAELPAVVDESGSMTFAQLDEETRGVARAARGLGTRPGDAAAIWAPNGRRWIITALGLLRAGVTVVPISTRFRGTETADILRRSRSRLLFTVRGFLGTDYIRLLRDTGAELGGLAHTVILDGDTEPSEHDWESFLAAQRHAPAATGTQGSVTADSVSDVLFTSGTTGLPKGVMSTHGQTLKVYARWSEVATLRPGDRYLLINPFSHTFGYKAGILACVMRGVTMYPLAVFDPEVVMRTIASERISVLLGPPTLFTSILDHEQLAAHDLSPLRLAGTGGATVPVELVRRVREELGVGGMFTAYGLTESAGVVSVCPPDADAERVATTVGPPLPGTELRIVGSDGRAVAPGEHGEIQTRGDNVMLGYLDDPEATRAAIDDDGWLHTGDVGTVDPDGYLSITDRLKDMFIVGGFNAYPAEIERALTEHPAVREVAVVGTPDDRLGEVGHAVVVPADGEATDADGIISWARERMAGYKVPRSVEFRESLPRNATGKVLKRELRSKG